MSQSGTARDELSRLCIDRDLSDDARAELDRLVAAGSDHELLDVIEHLRKLPIVRRADLHPDPNVTARFVELWRASQRRAERHRVALANAARRFGREAREHRVTLSDAEAHLERLTLTMADDGSTFLVPLADARDIAGRSFAAAMQARQAA